MVRSRIETRRHTKRSVTATRGTSRRAFSLVDLLVSLGVIAVLMAMLLPAMKPVRETAKQLVCRSGVRQIGMGIAMYAEERADLLPGTGWALPKPAQTVYLRAYLGASLEWDGLGRLYSEQFLKTPGIFYCPSHFGDYRLVDNLWRWQAQEAIIGNYQYRGHGPKKQKHLSEVEPKNSALVSDSLRHVDEYSHRIGANVLRADLSVFWFHDTNGVIAGQLGNGPGEGGMTQTNSINVFWNLFDTVR